MNTATLKLSVSSENYHTVTLPSLILDALPVADPGFSPGGAPTPKSAIIFQFFPENCMKMKEFGPPGGARVPGAPLRSANDFIMKTPFTKSFILNVNKESLSVKTP